jgi:prevent-host-death family protein
MFMMPMPPTTSAIPAIEARSQVIDAGRLGGRLRHLVLRLHAVRRGYNSLVKTATISETKNSLSALLDRVRHGESILITDRSVPIARLEPVGGSDAPGPDEGRLARLERAGVIRRARRAHLDDIARVPPPAAEAGADILNVLLAERRGGR